MNVINMSVKYETNLYNIEQEILDKNCKSENSFFYLSFDSSQLDIYVTSLDREKPGLLIYLSNVYVPYLVLRISP